MCCTRLWLGNVTRSSICTPGVPWPQLFSRSPGHPIPLTVFAFAPPVGISQDIPTVHNSFRTHAFTVRVLRTQGPAFQEPQKLEGYLNPSGDHQQQRRAQPLIQAFHLPQALLFGLSPAADSASPPLIRWLLAHCFSVYSPFNYPASAPAPTSILLCTFPDQSLILPCYQVLTKNNHLSAAERRQRPPSLLLRCRLNRSLAPIAPTSIQYGRDQAKSLEQFISLAHKQ